MILTSPAARPQPRPSPKSAFISPPDPAASRRAWAGLLASWQSRQAELAAADTEREIDAMLVRQIEAAHQRRLTGRTRAERTMASNAIRVLSAARMPEQVRRLEIERGLTR